MSSIVDRAKVLATMVHINEVRKGSGKPYIVHPEAVYEIVKGNGEIIESAAWLHDVLENAENKETIRLLLNDYFPRELVHLIETLTNDKNVRYQRYIEIVCNDKNATMIKIADMIDNTSDEIPEKQKDKYRDSVNYMLSREIEIPNILLERLNIKHGNEMLQM